MSLRVDRPWKVCAAVFLLALTVRVGFNLGVVGRDYEPIGDALDYVRIADNVRHGRGYSVFFADRSLRPTARRPPAFPLFLAASFSLFGRDFLAPRLVLSAVGAGTCSLLSFLALRLFGG